MNKTMYPLVLVLTLLFAGYGCKKEENDTWPEWSVFRALKNGEKWVGKAFAYKYEDRNDTVQITGMVYDSSFYDMTETFHISNVPLAIGLYILDVKTVIFSYYETHGHDAIKANFYLDESSNNFIEIRDINFSSMEMSGIFQITFIRKDPQLSDKISFTDGSFRIKFGEYWE